MTRVFLDPDGSLDIGLLVVIEGNTGVVYEHQCAGYACEQRGVEGYLVPVGTRQAAASILRFFERFKGWPPPANQAWTPSLARELSDLVKEIPYWERREREDFRFSLQLDHHRLEEATEAWVPVLAAGHRAILLFENCD